VEDLTPIFPADSAVEYYSTTWNVWMQGVLAVAREGPMSNPRLAYDIVVDSGRRRQVRHSVPLNGMRRVLWKGESVEVWLPESSKWTPGIVADDPTARFAKAGYQVKMGEEVVHVPRQMVRRRFEDGQAVRIYQGPRAGWTTATVDKASTEGAAIGGGGAAALVPHSESHALEDDYDKVLSDDEFAAEIQRGSVENNALPWTLVPVRGLGDDDQVKFIPSYLLLPPGNEVRAIGAPNAATPAQSPRSNAASGVAITFAVVGGAEVTHVFSRSFMGFSFAKVPPVVTHVVPGSQADEFGVLPDMTMLAIGTQRLAGMPFDRIEQTLHEALASLPPDADSVELWSMEI